LIDDVELDDVLGVCKSILLRIWHKSNYWEIDDKIFAT
jgi:hypothetical protein